MLDLIPIIFLGLGILCALGTIGVFVWALAEDTPVREVQSMGACFRASGASMDEFIKAEE